MKIFSIGVISIKITKIIFYGVGLFALVAGTYQFTQRGINKYNTSYKEKAPLIEEKTSTEESPKDIDKMIFHGVDGKGEVTLDVEYKEDFTVYNDKLYVTNNKGKTWMEVMDDDYVGYADVSQYLDDISESNVYTSDEKVVIAYGGRGSENISIIETDNQGDFWGITSISQTATHDLESGYEKIYIDFLDGSNEAYLVAIKAKGKYNKEILTYRSVNDGVTWDDVDDFDDLNKEIKAHFGI